MTESTSWSVLSSEILLDGVCWKSTDNSEEHVTPSSRLKSKRDNVPKWRKQRYVPEETILSAPSCKNLQAYEANLRLFIAIWVTLVCVSNLSFCDKRKWRQRRYALCKVTNNAFEIRVSLLPSSSDINCIGTQYFCYNQFLLFFTFHSMNKRFAFNRGSLLDRYYLRVILVCNFTRDLREINFDLSMSLLNLLMQNPLWIDNINTKDLHYGV